MRDPPTTFNVLMKGRMAVDGTNHWYTRRTYCIGGTELGSMLFLRFHTDI